MPKLIDYDYSAVPTIRQFARSDDFIRAMMGPVGGGKTSGGTIEFVRRAQAQKPGPDGIRRTRWAAIRNTYPQLRDTTMRTVFQWLPIEHFGKFHSLEHRYVVKAIPGCEFEIMFRALDRPDDIKNLLSLELTGAFVNEMREIPWAIIDTLQGRLGRYPPKVDGGATWFGMWGDTNPPDADSKFYKFFEEADYKNDDAYKEFIMLNPGQGFASIFKQPSGLSPEAENLPNLTPGYYQRLSIGKSSEWIKVYIHGQYGFVMDGKAVYPEYNDRVHCRDDVNPVSGPVVERGWDFGLTPACVFSQVLPDGRWLVFDEMIAEEMGIERFSDQVLLHCGRSFPPKTKFSDTGDPAGNQRAQTDEKTVFQILTAKGIDIQPGEQTLAMRLEAVRKPLNTMIAGEPQFLLHPRCRQLRKGFRGGYHFRRMATSADRWMDTPEKNDFSHPHDALQYTATRLFGDVLLRRQSEEDSTWPVRDWTDERGRSVVTGY